MIIELDVNGRRRSVDVDPGRSLLSVLREELELTGSKYGCGEGQCGACTVLLDRRAVRSCVTPVASALVQGIGGALFEAVDFENGVIRNARLAQYRVPRFSDVPSIEEVLVDRKDLPSMGAGETPIIALAPAVGAAIFDATGVRPRSLPMARSGLRENLSS